MQSLVALVLLVCSLTQVSAIVELGPLNIDPASVTVSGLSSGSAMATQLHVVLSSTINGAALFAGVPYHCASGAGTGGDSTCMIAPGLDTVPNLISDTDGEESMGTIDPTNNMMDDTVYLFAGTLDSVVDPVGSEMTQQFYEHYGATVVAEYTIEAEHSQPTDNYGPACSYLGGEYINNCAYNGAYEALNALYGDITKPDGTEELGGTLDLFDQSNFVSGGTPLSVSLDDFGYVYIPSACEDGATTCKLHVSLHGCMQGRAVIGDAYVSGGAYLQVAELNNIVVVFPQAVQKALTNPNGCWDWWGYTGVDYVGNGAPQIMAIKAMIDTIVG